MIKVVKGNSMQWCDCCGRLTELHIIGEGDICIECLQRGDRKRNGVAYLLKILDDEICFAYDLSYKDLMKNTGNQARKYTEPRMLMMYIRNTYFGFSLSMAAKEFDKDHAAVVYARKNIQVWLKYNWEFKAKTSHIFAIIKDNELVLNNALNKDYRASNIEVVIDESKLKCRKQRITSKSIDNLVEKERFDEKIKEFESFCKKELETAIDSICEKFTTIISDLKKINNVG